jgi:hypothetical protein
MDDVHEEITKIPDEFKELAIGKIVWVCPRLDNERRAAIVTRVINKSKGIIDASVFYLPGDFKDTLNTMFSYSEEGGYASWCWQKRE